MKFKLKAYIEEFKDDLFAQWNKKISKIVMKIDVNKFGYNVKETLLLTLLQCAILSTNHLNFMKFKF